MLINPNALLFIALCTVLGVIVGHLLIGLAVGMLVVLIVSVSP